MPRRVLAALLTGVLGLVSVALVAIPAQAAPAGWADFTFTGSSPNFTGTMTQQPTGFPAATFVSSSAGGSVGRQSGASTFLAPATDVGAKYGSSRNRPYLNLRPGTAGGGPPSITTYTFERPTPATG